MKSFHISRWKYALGYFIVAALAVVAMWAYDRGHNRFGILLGIAAVVLFIVFEMVIRKKRLYLGETEVRVIDRKNGVTMQYEDITDVHVHQSFFGKVLSFGDVRIKSVKEEIVLKDFEWPRKVEKLISSKR